MSASLTIAAGSEGELARVVRESLHLADGDRVIVEQRDGEVVLRRGEPDAEPAVGSPKIFQENGHWVFSAGQPSNYSIADLIDEIRMERIRRHGGE
jgi:hypothetical protein